MAKRGAREQYRQDFHVQDFLEQSTIGKDIKQIAKRWKVARSTIYDWADRHSEFAYTIKYGKELCEAWYMDLGQAAMVGMAKMDGKPIRVDLGWFCWMTKNIFKWSDRVDQTIDDITDPKNKPKPVVINISEVKKVLEKIRKDY